MTREQCATCESQGGGGEVLGKSLVGVCRWDSETLNLYQTIFKSFLQPYSILDAKNPYPIQDYLFSSYLSEI